METRRATHPTADVLKAFGLGKLDDSSSGELMVHLDLCGECRKIVAAQSGDDFLDRLRQAYSRNATPAPAESPTRDEGKPKPPPGPTTLFNLPPELADNPQYEILKELGRGGMGVVYLAKNKLMDRLEVLKVINKTLLDRPGAVERFLREIRAAAKLNHVNVVNAHSALQLGDLLVFAMEYVDGQDLAAVVKGQGPLPVAHACFYVQQAAQGLQHAFEKKMVHRDIKPQNLILAREGKKHLVKVLDFGLAKVLREKPGDTGLTGAGKILGTPDYMAPEQTLDATSSDIRADIYSLGCTLYYLLSGKPPFKCKSLYEIMQAHQSMEAPALTATRPEVPEELAAVVRKMMTKDRNQRYQTPLEVVQALKPFLKQDTGSRAPVAEEPEKTAPSQSPAAGRTRPRRIAVLSGMGIGVLLLVLFGMWVAGVFRVRTPDGVLVIQVNEPNADVYVDGAKVTVTWEDGGKRAEIRVKPGTRKVEVRKKGFVVFGEELTVESKGQQIFVARLDRPAAPAKAAEPVSPSAELAALKRDQIPPEALAAAGDGDPKRAPTRLVGVLGDPQPIHGSLVSGFDKSYVHGLAFSSDGRWLASGGNDGSVILRDAATGRARRLFRGHTAPVRHVAFSKDCKTLVSAGLEGTVKLWPVEKDGEPLTLQPQLGELWSLAVSADGGFLAVGGTTGGVQLWKWGQWDTPLKFAGDSKKPWASFTKWENRNCLALSPDGRYLAVQTQESEEKSKESAPVYLFKTKDGTLADTLPAAWSGFVLTFSADGTYLASWAGHRRTTVWEVASRKRVAEFPAAQFGGVAISPDNARIAVSISFAVGIEVFNLKTQQQEQTVGHGLNDSMSVAFSPDGKTLAAGFFDGSVHLWNTTTWEEIYQERGHGRSVTSVQFRPDGRAILSASEDNTVRHWNLSRPRENRILRKIPARLSQARYSPDGKKYATVVNSVWYDPTKTIVVWDSATGRELFAVKPPVGLDGIVFSPDGKYLAGSSWPVNDADKSTFVYLWDAETGNVVHRFADFGDVRPCLPAFSKDGKLLAAASPKQVKVWEVASGNKLHTWQDDLLCAVAFSPDGKTLATGHTNGTITVWDLTTQKKKKSFAGHLASVQSLTFTPDGKKLISSGNDGTVRVWNPEWNRPVEVFTLGPPNGRTVMDVDPSGKYLVAASSSTAIFLLRLPD